MRFSSKKSACTKSRKIAFAVQKFLWQMHFAQKHHSRPKHHKNKRHAPKTKLFTSSTKFGCSSTILHHFQSWSQPKCCWHQKWAARPNSHWVIAHVHHMHRSVYFHTPFCYELPVRQLPSSEAQSSHVACKYVSSHPPTIVRISTKSFLHVGCRCFQITYVR